MILALAVAVGLIAAKLAGGKLRLLVDPGFRALALPVASALLQAGAGWAAPHLPWPAEAWYPGLVCLTYGMNLVFCVFNRKLWLGSLLAALGTLGNLTVIALNGWRMPVAAAAFQGAPRLGYCPLDGLTRWAWLGDVIPLPLPVVGGVISVGDLLLCAGVIAWVVARCLKGGRKFAPGPEATR